MQNSSQSVEELKQMIADREAVIAKLRALVTEMHQALNPGCQLATIMPQVEAPPFSVDYEE